MISTLITKNDTAKNWSDSTVPLALGEFGFDTINKILKIGDGKTLWNDLKPLGGSSDAGVTHGSFFGNGTTSVSINVGTARAKKIIIACEATGSLLMETRGIFSLDYNAVTGKGSLTYQGASTGYIGSQDETYFTVTYDEITDSDGTVEYVYTIVHSYGSDTRLFQNGLKYNWYCITNDISVSTTNDFSQMANGTYTAPDSDTLLSNDITINVGFKPKVFAMFIQEKTQFNDNTNLKVVSTFFSADSLGNIIYAGTNFSYKDSSTTNAYSGYSENAKNIFYPNSNGVYGGTASNVYLKGGATYLWFALG